jgi:hypothetical protein
MTSMEKTGECLTVMTSAAVDSTAESFLTLLNRGSAGSSVGEISVEQQSETIVEGIWQNASCGHQP